MGYTRKNRRKRNNTKRLVGGKLQTPTFHILICSIGRPSLKIILDSLKNQLSADDAITIIFDGPEALKNSTYTDDWVNNFKCSITEYKSDFF